MFLTVLCGTLALGAGLLAAASYGDGALVAARTAALTIGWLLVLATLIGVHGMRRARLPELGATAVVSVSAVAVLYLSHFSWVELPKAAMPQAVVEVLIEIDTDVKLIRTDAFSPSVMRASLPVMARAAVPQLAKEPPSWPMPKSVWPKEEVADSCSSLSGVEALQCRRCGSKRGLSWVACQENARLEYCQERYADEAACPSPIPASYPG
ncbi:MAG TPA: hypothetical protein VFR66_11115 [Burkholderiales bacterium]|nr:hypothetical protein [Burkholderiales bacterium]